MMDVIEYNTLDMFLAMVTIDKPEEIFKGDFLENEFATIIKPAGVPGVSEYCYEHEFSYLSGGTIHKFTMKVTNSPGRFTYAMAESAREELDAKLAQHVETLPDSKVYDGRFLQFKGTDRYILEFTGENSVRDWKRHLPEIGGRFFSYDNHDQQKTTLLFKSDGLVPKNLYYMCSAPIVQGQKLARRYQAADLKSIKELSPLLNFL